MTEQVQQLVTMSLKQPVRLAADAAGRAPEELRQEIVRLKVRVCPYCLMTELGMQNLICCACCVLAQQEVSCDESGDTRAVQLTANSVGSDLRPRVQSCTL